jgi:hypothetical protein
VIRFQQIAGHWRAHMAEADESDSHSRLSIFFLGFALRVQQRSLAERVAARDQPFQSQATSARARRRLKACLLVVAGAARARQANLFASRLFG